MPWQDAAKVHCYRYVRIECSLCCPPMRRCDTHFRPKDTQGCVQTSGTEDCLTQRQHCKPGTTFCSLQFHRTPQTAYVTVSPAGANMRRSPQHVLVLTPWYQRIRAFTALFVGTKPLVSEQGLVRFKSKVKSKCLSLDSPHPTPPRLAPVSRTCLSISKCRSSMFNFDGQKSWYAVCLYVR